MALELVGLAERSLTQWERLRAWSLAAGLHWTGEGAEQTPGEWSAVPVGLVAKQTRGKDF